MVAAIQGDQEAGNVFWGVAISDVFVINLIGILQGRIEISPLLCQKNWDNGRFSRDGGRGGNRTHDAILESMHLFTCLLKIITCPVD